MARKSNYWSALTLEGMKYITSNSKLTGRDIKLFLMLAFLIDKDTNQIISSNHDIMELAKNNGSNFNKSGFYISINNLIAEQIIARLEDTKGYMLNPFIIYSGKKMTLQPKIDEFKKIAKLTPDTKINFTIPEQLSKMFYDEDDENDYYGF